MTSQWLTPLQAAFLTRFFSTDTGQLFFLTGGTALAAYHLHHRLSVDLDLFTLDDLALVRVYIKNQEDYSQTRAVCEQRLGELPVVYAVADVCRPELLVEIEGIAFSSQAG